MTTLTETTESVPAAVDRFDALFGHFYPGLYGLAFRVLGERMASEDIIQEAFLKLSDDAALQSRPDVEVGAWLRTVCLNLAFNRIRGERRARARLEQVGRLESGEASESPAALLLRLEDQAEVRRALVEVPERQRDCLLLRHSGYSYA